MVETPGGDITDRELQDVLRQMKSNFPSLGQTGRVLELVMQEFGMLLEPLTLYSLLCNGTK